VEGIFAILILKLNGGLERNERFHLQAGRGLVISMGML
jgi:hypothetical protein